MHAEYSFIYFLCQDKKENEYKETTRKDENVEYSWNTNGWIL